MIALISGTLALREADTIVVDAHGVGYELSVSSRTLESLPPLETPVRLHVLTVVREDAFTLYGFGSRSEKALFVALTSVTGIGPRVALNALGALRPGDLRQALMRGDTTALSRISGVGKKTAQRMVLELADKVAGIDLEAGNEPTLATTGPVAVTPTAVAADIHSAILNLGYPEKRAEQVVKELDSRIREGEPLDALLRAAFALLRSQSPAP